MALFSPSKVKKNSLLFALVMLTAVSCIPQPQSDILIPVSIIIDGQQIDSALPEGSTVQDTLAHLAIEIDLLDRVAPEPGTEISQNLRITVTRISEEFAVEEIPIPFEQLILRNESLDLGEKKLLQVGANGLSEETYRLLYEDGILLSQSLISSEIVIQPEDEIIMLGVQAPAESLSLPGKIAFIVSGNAWIIDAESGARSALITSGDLDGRVFSLSPNGNWLLFSRISPDDNEINALWLRSTQEATAIEINLVTQSVIHFADWLPSANSQFLFSTVEKSSNPPGWLANNDLRSIQINSSGQVVDRRTILNKNLDVLYAWWGANFAIAPNGDFVALSSATGISLINLDDGLQEELKDMLPFQSESEWVWNPPIAWSADSAHLFTVEHVELSGLQNQERSPIFDLISIDIESLEIEKIISTVGMFANPSSVNQSHQTDRQLLAYLKAVNPLQSEISTYQLQLTNLGNNQSIASFPPQGSPGLEAQTLHWSPLPVSDSESHYLAFIYLGNIWIINGANGQPSQLTSDGLVTRLDWSP